MGTFPARPGFRLARSSTLLPRRQLCQTCGRPPPRAPRPRGEPARPRSCPGKDGARAQDAGSLDRTKFYAARAVFLG
ncbi:Acyl-Coa Dehydrogenase Family Member 10 [Manis pentadactyla]|nr:Acyl-Coa Dehydrogenase Family Member 10 [Manis pentadactyla]